MHRSQKTVRTSTFLYVTKLSSADKIWLFSIPSEIDVWGEDEEELLSSEELPGSSLCNSIGRSGLLDKPNKVISDYYITTGLKS